MVHSKWMAKESLIEELFTRTSFPFKEQGKGYLCSIYHCAGGLGQCHLARKKK
jgi:hypothetical protein